MIDFHGISIESEEIVDFLKREMLLKDICQKIVSQKIIKKAAAEKDITVTPEEIQTEADSIRYGMRLEKASDTLAWLVDQMVSADEWERGIGDRLLAKKLAEHLFDREVEKYFAQNRLDFDQFILYQIVVPYQQLAQEIFYQIEEEEISFYEAAHLYDIDERRRYVCGYEGKVHRWNFPPDVAAAVFRSPIPVGEILGPHKTEQGYHLFRIEEFIQAELSPLHRQEILDRLFKEWLESELNYSLHNV
jgi:parvulin-like peptidyl-prolyl isomerase